MGRTLQFLVLICACVASSTAFQVTPSAVYATASSTALFDSPPARQPRRNLQKRRRRNREGPAGQKTPKEEEFPWDTAESRPMVTAQAIESGEDYWIDQKELKAQQERKEALKRSQPGQITKEKLWVEVLSPYKQNWIGIISVVIIILATIVTKFPELLNTPVITIPDL